MQKLMGCLGLLRAGLGVLWEKSSKTLKNHALKNYVTVR
jgi:hypothetical protein